MSQSVIQISSLSRRFGEKNAVDNLTLEVQAGEIFGFLGHNGAGKTTTVRLLNGVLEPTSGGAQVLGLDPQTEGPALRARTGVLTETPSLEERLTARENLSIYADLYNVPLADVAERVNSLLAEFELADRADEKVGGYSKGMKQRLALARALLHKPDVLFLDEPTAALDPVAARHVHSLVENLARREGCTVFLCTHNLVEAQKLCDRVAVMEHGQLVALGTPADLTRQYVKRLDVDLEVDPVQMELVLPILQELPHLVLGSPKQEKDFLTLTLSGREAIPELLAVLVQKGLARVSPRATGSQSRRSLFRVERRQTMNTRAVLAIVRKDLKVAVQNKGVVLPIIILPLILFVVMPWLMAYIPSWANAAGTSLSNMDELLARMPAGLQNELSGYTPDQQLTVFSLVYMLAPMFLILPLMVSSVLAADSFAGEKERKTLEALLIYPNH